MDPVTDLTWVITRRTRCPLFKAISLFRNIFSPFGAPPDFSARWHPRSSKIIKDRENYITPRKRERERRKRRDWSGNHKAPWPPLTTYIIMKQTDHSLLFAVLRSQFFFLFFCFIVQKEICGREMNSERLSKGIQKKASYDKRKEKRAWFSLVALIWCEYKKINMRLIIIL